MRLQIDNQLRGTPCDVLLWPAAAAAAAASSSSGATTSESNAAVEGHGDGATLAAEQAGADGARRLPFVRIALAQLLNDAETTSRRQLSSSSSSLAINDDESVAAADADKVPVFDNAVDHYRYVSVLLQVIRVFERSFDRCFIWQTFRNSMSVWNLLVYWDW
jgi:hypothetical protein